MGVKGLWPMLESAAGKADLHNASGKVLAVDISIWIQQIVKGMRDGEISEWESRPALSLPLSLSLSPPRSLAPSLHAHPPHLLCARL
jgi:hypothetical protein